MVQTNHTYPNLTRLADRRSAASFAATLSIVVSAGRQVGSRTESISLDAIALRSYLTPSGNILPNGGSMVLSGSHLGKYLMSSAARGGGSASESTLWTSETGLIAKTVAGNLHSAVTKVTAGGKNVGSHGSLTFSLSYDAPSMSQMTPPNREIASAQSMNMTGFGFRQTEYSMRSRPHTSDAEASLWISHSAISCRPTVVSEYPQPGVNLKFVMTAGIVPSTISNPFLYDSLFLSGVEKTNSPATGSITSVLYGQRFAVLPQTAKSSLGHTGSESTSWVSDTSIALQSPSGLFATLTVSATIASIPATFTEILSYQTPSLFGHAYNTRQTMTSRQFFLTGDSFGHTDPSEFVRAGMSSCEGSTWHSQTSVSLSRSG